MTTVALPGKSLHRRNTAWQRGLTRNAWVLGMWLLLGALIF